MNNTIDAVDAYINKFDDDVRDRLIEIRLLILSEVPNAEESISYGLVGYKLNGKPLVYFGGFDHHIGFYATPNGHQEFRHEFAIYKQGRGSVQFPLDQPLPIDLVKRVVLFRARALMAV